MEKVDDMRRLRRKISNHGRDLGQAKEKKKRMIGHSSWFGIIEVFQDTGIRKFIGSYHFFIRIYSFFVRCD